MVADHLRASELFAIDIRTPEGLASLTAILGQALQAGLIAGEAQREEEARKAAEAKAAEKKRKRDERATIGALSPRTLEKKRRKDERDAIRKEKLDLKKKEEERKKLLLITLAEEGIPIELAYVGAKSTIRHIVSTNFARGVEGGKGRAEESDKSVESNKAAEGDHIAASQGQEGKRVGEYKRYKRKITAAEMTMGQEHGKEHLFEHVDALLASEGESESCQGSSDEEERGGSTVPSATTSSGPSSIASRNAGSTGGKDKEDREEEDKEDEEEEYSYQYFVAILPFFLKRWPIFFKF
ncbi:unnamed protein product [Sphagnum troendelagicum]